MGRIQVRWNPLNPAEQGFRTLHVRFDMYPAVPPDKYWVGPDGEFNVITTHWKPDAEQIKKIIAGEPIAIHLFASKHPPIQVTVGDQFAN